MRVPKIADELRPPRSEDDPDADIARLAIAGAFETALGLLMRRHGTSVYRYCREALRDRALADDVHQYIFIQAHRDLGRFAGKSTVRTWLFAITRHRVLDAIKMRRRAQAHLEQEASADTTDPAPSAGELLDDGRLRRVLIECLRELPPDMRLALLLRYQQGFSFEQIAEICHQKPGTLQARVARALPRLRAAIEARGLGR
jgi:RNA polymerase sigma-70 factor (ECF subfamily)